MGTDTGNAHVKRKYKEFDIYVKNDVLHNATDDRLQYRYNLIAQRLKELQGSLEKIRELYMQKKKHRLEFAMQQLDSMSPVHVLRRGYGFISDANGKSIRKITQVKNDMRLKITLVDGTFTSIVESVGQEGKHG